MFLYSGSLKMGQPVYQLMGRKVFYIDGQNFKDLEGFFEAIGSQLVENNNWGKNWNALNDILRGGFLKSEYEEPFVLIWRNSDYSKKILEDYDDIVKLIESHSHIELMLK